MRFSRIAPTLTAALATLILVAPGGLAAQKLTGAGATFPDLIYKKWFSEYNTRTGVQINYQSLGSGTGIKQFTEKTVDFGATDGPMSQDQMNAVQGEVIHIPTVLGAVVLTWNVPELGATKLKLSGPVIADIFLGKVKKWNDPAIAALNPGAKLPNADLLVVHRSDGSGTSFIFTDYLSKVSPEWKSKVGTGQSVNWPTGLGGSGNAGVTQTIKQNEGTIGYVELIYAVNQKLPFADVKNAAGSFVTPSIASVTAAAASARFAANTDFRVSITNAPGAESYPIASFTWLLVRPKTADAAKGKVLKDFLTWMVTPEAQAMATSLSYAPLPPAVQSLVVARIKTLK